VAPTPEARREAQRTLRDASLELARLRRIRGASHLTRRRIARARRRLAAAAVLLGSVAAAHPAAALDPVFRHGFLLDGGLIDGSFLIGVSDLVDIDGDGDFDLFWSYGSDVHLALNTGTATRPAFAATSQTNPFGLVGPAGYYAFPKFADLDGDGDLDAVDDDAFLENTGSASAPAFAARVPNAFGLLGSVTDLVDFDGDGDLDALTRFGQTRFLENTGTTTAPAFVARPGSFGLASETITFVDVDGDGDLDGFGSTYAIGATFQRNTGSASAPAFAAPQTQTFGLSRFSVLRYVAFAFADVDGDGDLDAVAGGYTYGAEVMAPFENTGTATAPAFTHVANSFGLGRPFVAETTAGFGDIDGDGDLDAFLNAGFSRNTGSASLPAFAPDPIPALALFGKDPDLADLDGDGDTDALVGVGSGDLLFFENTAVAGTPSFAPAVTNPFGLANAGGYASPDLADLDGDGDLDALVGNGAGQLVWFQNTGSAVAPAFAAGITNPFGLATLVFSASPDLADLDGDGDLDAFVGISSGNVFRFTNTGTATAPAFAPHQLVPDLGILQVGLPLGGYSAPAFVDLDGDGDLDALIGRRPGGVAFFRNTGTASAAVFAPGVVPAFGLGNSPGAESYSSVALADFDGDGDIDAVTGNLAGVVTTFHNVGSATAPRFVKPGASSPFGFNMWKADLVDIDADGDLDVMSGTLWYENSGSASQPAFANPVQQAFGLPNTGSLAASSFADLDADGDRDALIGKSDGNLLLAWNTGTASVPAFGAPATNPFGLSDVGNDASPELVDLDGDGDLDVLVGGIDGHLRFFRNTGSASTPAFAAAQLEPFGLVRAPQLNPFSSNDRLGPHPEVADIDADGDLDVLVADGLGRVVFFENLNVSATACTDAVDNDGDGRIDLGPGAGTDPGCTSAADPSELGTKQCDNGEDDDGDGKIDFRPNGTGDPQCVGPLDDREAPDPPPPSGGCGLGPELLLLAPLLEAERRRRRRLRAAG
jgi:hypothetical protein